MKYPTKKTAILSAVVVLFVIMAASFLRGSGNKGVVYRTAAVKKGDLLAAISATGTVEPEEVVDVGAQVAGQINSFGKDKNGKTIDYGSVVEEGTILAQIDDSLYAADVAMANAQLQQARAGVLRTEADLGQLKSRLNQAKRDWDRAQKLGPSEALAQSSMMRINPPMKSRRLMWRSARRRLFSPEMPLPRLRQRCSGASETLATAPSNPR